MHSLQTKTTLLPVFAIVATMAAAMILSVIAIHNLGSSSSDQILFLLCESGEKNLDSHFERVEQSVETISSYAEADLAAVDLRELGGHLERVRDLFEKTANNTEGILTYYYRIDPEISTTDKGFWYVDLDGTGFQEHTVTDLTLYDTQDQSDLVWFTVPKATGSSIWLPPYFTENLDVYVLSYNTPIYKDDTFIGVIGIELDYTTISEPVSHITLYENGYAFLNDQEGNIIYHPRMSQDTVSGDQKPTVPKGLLSESTYIRYTFEGVEKQAVWLPLDNGMRLNVTVPISEINADWHRLVRELLSISALLLLVFAALTLRLGGQITRPLRKLTQAAEQFSLGNYDVELDYQGSDEVGILTQTVRQLIEHLKVYIDDLNSLAYSDALTSVHNKGAFDIYAREMQAKLDEGQEHPPFAIGVFDCDNLKRINDQYGHDKGDIYIKNASTLICLAFPHSPVFRTGGDEFTMILQNEDYRQRETLIQHFLQRSADISAHAREPWEKANISMGIAAYNRFTDSSVNDVIRRADKLMYENKRRRKAEGQ